MQILIDLYVYLYLVPGFILNSVDGKSESYQIYGVYSKPCLVHLNQRRSLHGEGKGRSPWPTELMDEREILTLNDLRIDSL